jgi:addiction module HigA family antidote
MTIEGLEAMTERLHNPHAGEILFHEFMEELSMSQNALARALGVPANRINAIVNGTRRITADTDLRLCKYFGLSEGYFLRLQNQYETMEAKREMSDILEKIVPYVAVTDNRTGA